MVDRVAEIREALASFARHEPELPKTRLKTVLSAAQELLDLLDSDALIIRRDEDGEWPEWTRRAIADLGPWAGNADQILDALASSQGVEPQ